MSAANGWIYVMTTGSMPTLYKVGATIFDPLIRARQLSASTSAASPFVVAYSRQVNNPFAVEAALHKILDQYRVNDSREFFKLPLHEIIELIERYDEARQLMFTNDVALPFSKLFASFEPRAPGDEYENALSPDEQRACRRLEEQVLR